METGDADPGRIQANEKANFDRNRVAAGAGMPTWHNLRKSIIAGFEA